MVRPLCSTWKTFTTSHFSRFLTPSTFFWWLKTRSAFMIWHRVKSSSRPDNTKSQLNCAECEIEVSSGWQCKWWIPPIDSMILVKSDSSTSGILFVRNDYSSEGGTLYCMSYGGAMACPILTLLHPNMHIIWLPSLLSISMYSLYANSSRVTT